MASVSKREWKGPDGKERSAFVVRYKEGGKHRSRQFDKKKDADAYRKRVEAEIESGSHVARTEQWTIRQAVEPFIRSQEDRWRDGRIGQGRYMQIKCALDVSIVPLLGDLLMQEMGVADVEDFYDKMRRSGGRANGIGAKTADSRMHVLLMLFEYAIKRRACAVNPVPGARKQLRGISRKPIRTFTQDEVQRILAAVEHRGRGCHERAHQFRRIAVHLAAFCGLRLGEILGLTLDNIDTEQRIVRVRHNLTVWDELKQPKTAAGVRDVPMPAHIATYIREYRARFYSDNERHLLFRSFKGTQILHSVFNLSYWIPALKRAGLDKTRDQPHFHALRHFAASWMIQNGLSLPDVASLLGHRKFDMTLQVYAHSIIGGHQKHAAFDRMAEELARLPGPMIEGSAAGLCDA